MVSAGVLTLLITFVALRPQIADSVLTMRFIVGQPPLDSTLADEQERYYTWVTSEYVVFSLSDWINGTAFFEMLIEDLQTQNLEFEYKELKAKVGATSYRSILLMEVRGTDREEIITIAEAASDIVTTLPDVDIPQLRLAPPILFPIDSVPSIVEPPTSIVAQLRFPLSITLAFLFAILSALFAERNDKTIRSRDAASNLRLPILGEIPSN